MTRVFEKLNSRLSVRDPSLAERYIEGRLNIAVPLRTKCCDQEHHVIVGPGKFNVILPIDNSELRRKRLDRLVEVVFPRHRIGLRKQMPPARRSHHQQESVGDSELVCPDELHANLGGDQKGLMFVVQVHVVDGLKDMTFTAGVSFGFPQKLYDIPGQVFFQPRKGSFKSLRAFPARGEAESPVPFIVSGGALVCNFCEHLIKRRSNIVDGVGGNGLKVWWDALGNEAPCLPIEIDIGPDFIRARCVEGFDADIQLGDESFGPFQFGDTEGQRFTVHDLESIMAKSDDLKATKALMGALVRMKPKQHDEMKIGNSKAKKAKSLVKKRASSKPKTA